MQPPEVQGSSRTKEPSKPKPTLPNPSPTPRYVVPACKRGRTALGALLAFDNLGQDEAAAAGGPLRSTRLELSERIPSTAARLPPLKREGARPRRVSVALAPKAGPGQQPKGSERARPGLPVEPAGPARRTSPSSSLRRPAPPGGASGSGTGGGGGRAGPAARRAPASPSHRRPFLFCFSFFIFFPGFFQRESCRGDKTLGKQGPALPAAPPGPALHGAPRVSRGGQQPSHPQDSQPSSSPSWWNCQEKGAATAGDALVWSLTCQEGR